jgi:hypothetical protein
MEPEAGIAIITVDKPDFTSKLEETKQVTFY